MTARFGRGRLLARRAGLLGAVWAAVVAAGACGAPATPPDTQGSGGRLGSLASTPGDVGTAGPNASPRELTGLRLPAGIEPGGLDGDRFVFADRDGVAVLSLGTSNVLRLPPPPRGLAFRPAALAGNIVVGEVLGTRADPRAIEAMAYDIAGRTWADIGATLPTGDSSSATATDALSVVGMDLGPVGGQDPGRAYVYDIPSGTVTFLPSLPDGTVPVPAGVEGGHIVGFAGSAEKGGGWVWDQAAASYTSLSAAAGSDRASALAVAGDTVVGVLNGSAPTADAAFVYDIPSKAFTDLKLPGSRALGVNGRLVLVAAEAGWNGWLLDLDTGAQAAFDKVLVDGVATGVRPWAMGGGWVIALTPASAGSGADFGEVVAIPVAGHP